MTVCLWHRTATREPAFAQGTTACGMTRSGRLRLTRPTNSPAMRGLQAICIGIAGSWRRCTLHASLGDRRVLRGECEKWWPEQANLLRLAAAVRFQDRCIACAYAPTGLIATCSSWGPCDSTDSGAATVAGMRRLRHKLEDTSSSAAAATTNMDTVEGASKTPWGSLPPTAMGVCYS